MAKIIVLSLDGTLNAPHGKPSHIQKMQELILPQEFDAAKSINSPVQGWETHYYYQKENKINVLKRIHYYDKGLGSPVLDSHKAVKSWVNPLEFAEKLTYKFQQINEAAFGIGITDNVAQAYHCLAENYEQGKLIEANKREPGDSVYCYGFSRGAYTALLLVAMIRYIGLINIHSDAFKEKYGHDLYTAVKDGFECYDSNVHPDDNKAAKAFKEAFCHDGKHLIHFLGLLEPVKGLVLESLHAENRLSNVPKHIFAAYAINEERALYKPKVFIPSKESFYSQVWIPGSHSDIGGGRNNAFENISLHWLMQETMGCGLPINKQLLNEKYPTDPLGPQFDSMSGTVPFLQIEWKNFTSAYQREIPIRTHLNHTIHPCTYLRYGEKVKLEKKHAEPEEIIYSPSNVLSAVTLLSDPRKAGEKYAPVVSFNARYGYTLPKTFPLSEADKKKEMAKEEKLKACQQQRR